MNARLPRSLSRFPQVDRSGSFLQASHAAFSVALPSILLPPVGFSVETESAVS